MRSGQPSAHRSSSERVRSGLLGLVLAIAGCGDAGFTEGARTFFTWEGVPMYLTRAAVKATLDAVWRVSGSGSVIETAPT